MIELPEDFRDLLIELSDAGAPVAKLGSKAESAGELAFSLYALCEPESARPRRSRTKRWCRVGPKLRASRAGSAESQQVDLL